MQSNFITSEVFNYMEIVWKEIKQTLFNSSITLLVPYLPRLFQTAALAIVVLNAGEVLLGALANALIGLLGGAGIKWDSIKKIPNSRMINGIVENWSQSPGSQESFGINLILKIDGISAGKTAIICESLRSLPKSINLLGDQSLIWLDRLEQNARVITIRVFSNNLNFYEKACEQLNLHILALLEKEGINTLHVEFRTTLKDKSQLGKKLQIIEN